MLTDDDNDPPAMTSFDASARLPIGGGDGERTTLSDESSSSDDFIVVDDGTGRGAIVSRGYDETRDDNDDDNVVDRGCDDGGTVGCDEMRCLASLSEVAKNLLTNVLRTSPFVTGELVKLINLIGKDPDVTMLYETLTCVRQWRLAVSPYSQPVREHAMFGVMTYVLDCPLDRIVYATLVGQSLTVVYNTYKNWFTAERLRAATRYVHYLEGVRRCMASWGGDATAAFTAATSADGSHRRRRRDDDECRRRRDNGGSATERETNARSGRFLRETLRFFADRTHVILHDAIRWYLQRLNVDALEDTLRSGVSVIDDTMRQWLNVLRETIELVSARRDDCDDDETSRTKQPPPPPSPLSFSVEPRTMTPTESTTTNSTVVGGGGGPTRVTRERKRTRAAATKDTRSGRRRTVASSSL